MILTKEDRAIFKYLIAVVSNFSSMFIVAGVLLALCIKMKKRFPKIIFYIGILVGILGSIAQFLIKIFLTKETNLTVIKFNRYLIIAVACFSLFAFIANTIYILIRKKEKAKLFKNIFFIISVASIMMSILYILPQVLQLTREFVSFGENTISTQSIMRVVGFILGIVVSYMLYKATSKVGSFLNEKGFSIFCELIIFIYTIDFLLKAVSAWARLFPGRMNSLIFELMIIEDNYGSYLVYIMYIIVIVMLIRCVAINFKVVGEFKTPALKRKKRAEYRNHRRWSYTLASFVVIATLLLSVVNYYETKEVELAPAQEYQRDGNNILIPLTDLSDGHLHRFAYKTPNGYDVKFIAVKKPNGNAYGLGLDACEICGVAGYFERGDEVICKRCDVVMNKATIGFKGGCNPIPFPYNISNEKIVINTEDLEREEKRFQN